MKTLGEILRLAAAFLQDKKINQPRRQAEELLAHALLLKKIDLYLQYDRPIEERELALFRELIRRKSQQEPLEYILGATDFYHCTIHVDRSVLIPRPETEILVDLLCKKWKGQDLSGKILWDLCCGSGCIGIALKKAFPSLRVVLSDLSSEALSRAMQNARLNVVDVEFRQGDLLVPFAGERADFVTCNPPYISQSEYISLSPSVLHFEPKMALVGGETGYEFYEKLDQELPFYLKDGGKVFFEIGSTQGNVLKNIFSRGSWASFELNKDWSGLDRFFFLEKQ
jgi:release factor glutamine methyltransferase